jgi:hypothetical protein
MLENWVPNRISRQRLNSTISFFFLFLDIVRYILSILSGERVRTICGNKE